MKTSKARGSRSYWKQTAEKNQKCYEEVRLKYQALNADYKRLCNLLVDTKEPEKLLELAPELTEENETENEEV